MNFGCFFATSHIGDHPCRIRLSLPWRALVVLLSVLTLTAAAADAQQAVGAKTSVILIGANSANDALSTPLHAGPLVLDLYLQVDKPLPNARMQITNFQAQSTSADVFSATLNLFDGKQFGVVDALSEVSLAEPGLQHLRIAGGNLRAGTTYKGWLSLITGGQIYRWELTLAAGGQGIIAVDPVGTMKFSRWPWSNTGDFSVTLRDKPEGGPYHNLRARFEPSGAASSKAIGSNFSLDTFSFWEKSGEGLQRVDLEQRAAKAVSPTNAAAVYASVDLDRRGQRTFQVQIASLEPRRIYGRAALRR